MDLKEIVYLFSDSAINDYISLIASDFKVLGGVIVGPPAFWLLRKFTKLTPWKEDDLALDKLAQKMAIEEKKEGDKE